MTSSAYVLEAVGISKRFVSKHAPPKMVLEDFDLAIGPGEIYALFGPDGSGKSTIARILAGAISPTSGQVRVLGQDFAAQPDKAQQSIGYLATASRLYQELTVQENLDFFTSLYGISSAEKVRRIDELLSFSGLTEHRNRAAGTLSGGMRQKLALACTLAHRPPILVLDEPTTGLDPLARRDLWSLFYQLAAENTAIFLTTPYYDEAESCRTVGLLHDGRLIVQESPQELAQPYVGRVFEVDAAGRGRAKLREAIGSLDSVLISYGLGGTIRAITEGPAEAAFSEARHLFHALDWDLSPRLSEPRLEDAFAVLFLEKGLS